MYTIFCLLKGETVPFPVEIDETKSVGVLKDHIKEEMSAVDVEARKLELYHVNIKFDESHEERHIAQANEVLQGSTRQPLRLWLTLSKIAEGFPEGELHILIQLPPGESIHSRACGTAAEMYPPNLQCPPSLIIHYHYRPVYPSLIVYHSLQSLPYRPTSTSTPSVCFVVLQALKRKVSGEPTPTVQ